MTTALVDPLGVGPLQAPNAIAEVLEPYAGPAAGPLGGAITFAVAFVVLPVAFGLAEYGDVPVPMAGIAAAGALGVGVPQRAPDPAE